MAIRDHEAITISSFNGLFQRGRFDAVPENHFSDGLNFKFSEGGCDTRDGLTSIFSIASVTRSYVYKIYGQADHILALSAGSIYDLTISTSIPILTVSGMTDFGFVNMFGRAYLTPTNGVTGLPAEKLYVYIGSGVAIAAGGVAPTGTMTAANSASSGNVETGFHLFAVAYETETGFITAPGPAIFASVTAPGELSVDLSGIPLGPSNVSARRILATRIITNYNGNQTGYEFFFVPFGRIGDNTSTTLTVSFFDADLLTTADYLFDLYGTIPATLWLTSYHGRLIGGGENANPSIIRVSAPGQPEAINQVSGFIVVDPANSSYAVTAAQEYRDILYIFKPTRTYSTNDNGQEASTWQLTAIDQGAGADVHGIATILDTGGTSTDKVFVADHSGMLLFSGSYLRPPLTWKVTNIWERINPAAFNKVQIAIDPVAQLVYVALPLDGAADPTHILLMNYANCEVGLTYDWYKTVRWSLWTFGGSILPTSIDVHDDSNASYTPNILTIGSKNGNFYKLDPTKTNDAGVAIPTPFVTTALIPDEKDSSITHFAGAQFRIIGTGQLNLTLYSEDNATSQAMPALTLATAPGFEPFSLTNFNSTRARLKLSMANINDQFKINRIRIYVKELFKQLPY